MIELDVRISASGAPVVIHDANVEWDAGGGFALGLDVRNVFDRKTLDLLRYPLPGRVAFVHVGWRLGERR